MRRLDEEVEQYLEELDERRRQAAKLLLILPDRRDEVDDVDEQVERLLVLLLVAHEVLHLPVVALHHEAQELDEPHREVLPLLVLALERVRALRGERALGTHRLVGGDDVPAAVRKKLVAAALGR